MKKPKKEHKNVGNLNKKYIILACLAIALILSFSIYFISNNNKVSKQVRLTNSANQSAFDGDFTKAIESRKKLYSSESSTVRKAEIANEIASSYFALNDVSNAQIWVTKSVSDFNKVGLTDRANSVKQDAVQQVEQINNLKDSSNKQGTGANSALE